MRICAIDKLDREKQSETQEEDTCRLPLRDHHREDVVDVHMMDEPISGSGNIQKSMYCHHFSNRGKSLCKVHSFSLGITKNDQKGLVSFNRLINLMLDSKDPLATEGMFSWRERYRCPGFIVL